MKNIPLNIVIAFILISIFSSWTIPKSSFKMQQLKYPKVKEAYNDKQTLMDSLFKANGLNFKSCNIFIRIFKLNRQLELWAKNPKDITYKLIKTYPICKSTGNPGPKRKAGDKQVPEGFYEIERFNPNSDYFISLGISYPNKSDVINAKMNPTGGDIFIHGNCVTIGCIPITNDLIKELYICAVQARESGQMHIPVHIFPMEMTDNNFSFLKKEYEASKEMINFWGTLQKGYEYFEKNKSIPSVYINDKGEYTF